MFDLFYDSKTNKFKSFEHKYQTISNIKILNSFNLVERNLPLSGPESPLPTQSVFTAFCLPNQFLDKNTAGFPLCQSCPLKTGSKHPQAKSCEFKCKETPEETSGNATDSEFEELLDLKICQQPLESVVEQSSSNFLGFLIAGLVILLLTCFGVVYILTRPKKPKEVTFSRNLHDSYDGSLKPASNAESD